MLLILGVIVLTAISVTYWLPRPAQSPIMRHALTGYVLEVTPEINRITVRNADIPGVMASMIMDYRVRDGAMLTAIKPGDVIQATMVMDDAYWLEGIQITGKR